MGRASLLGVVLVWPAVLPAPAVERDTRTQPSLSVQVEVADPPAIVPKTQVPQGKPAGNVRAVYVVERDVPQQAFGKTVALKQLPGVFDRDSGRWVWRDLPSSTYDLIVDTTNGRFEGVDLRPRFEIDTPLAEGDRERIQKLVKSMKTFSDRKRILALNGNAQEADCLVELMRTTPTHLKKDKPSLIWRIERWDYRKRSGVWTRTRSPRVLRRFFVDRETFSSWHWNFLPRIGGIDVEQDRPVARRVRLPSRFTSALGLSASNAPAPKVLPQP
jgi:hypothetical protein